MSCLLGVAVVGIACQSFNVVDERLKVCVDDVRDFQLVLVILKGEFGFTFVRHLYSDGSSDTLAAGFVLFEKVLSCVSV